MEERKPISHIHAGLIIAAVLILFALILNFTGQSGNQSLSFLSYLIMIGGLIVFVNMYGNAMNNEVTFGNLFAYGFKATAVLTLIFIGFLIIFFLTFPEFKEKIFEQSRVQMEEQGILSDDQIDQGLEMLRNFFWVGIVGGTMLFNVIAGAIGSVIGAAITKKKPVNPLDQQMNM